MKASVEIKNPLERITRRSVLGVIGAGMTGVLVGCNDDLSPLSATLTSDMTDLSAAGSIMLTAKLDVGYANSVEFYDGTTLIDTVPLLAGQASKQVSLDASKNGKHTFITKITSNTGKQAYSNPVDVMVNIGVTPPVVFAPTISLTASSNSVTANGSITLTATAAATTGNISKVEFFEGTTKLGSVATAPFTFTTPAFTSTDNKTHSYTATVTTDASSLNTATSSVVDVVVNIPVPVVTIALASSDTALTAAKTITLTATVTGGTVSSVNFFDGATALGAGTAGANGTFTKDVVISGNPLSQTHSFTASSTFNAKAITSNAVTVNLNIALPVVMLTPSSTSITAVGNLDLIATVSSGTVTQVEFLDGSTSLSVVKTAPYKLTIPFTASSPAAAHSYVARVTIVETSTTIDSAPANVNVNIGNLAPTISLKSSSLNVTAKGSITLTATATAKTGTISSVEFFDGATSLGIVSAAPFTKTITLDTTNNGTHNYTAKATDSSGNSATSTPATSVVVNIQTVAPAITLASSSNSVTTAGSVNLTATVTPDPAVTISKVEFFEGTTLLSTVTVSPYVYAPSYAYANNGTHSYTAKATDSSGKSTTSSAVAVTVNIAATAPTISLTTTSSATVTAAGNIVLNATPTVDPNLTISKVELFDGATSLGLLTAPYSKTIAVTSANNGAHAYTAVITDSSNKTATSTTVNITVNISTTVTPPTVTLTATPTTVSASGTVALSARVTAGSGTITKVEFFDGATLLGTSSSTASPYAFTTPAYTSANNGTKSFTAKVTASDGGTVTSAVVNVTINIGTNTGTLIALYTALATAGSYVNFTHPTSKIACILYRAPTAQTGGVTNAAGAFFVAYSRKCTHAGTIITQNPNTATPHILTCQDHKAQYNMDNNCTPLTTSQTVAPAPLPSIVIKAGTDGIYI